MCIFFSIRHSQQQIAMIAEMIHTASLMHDDVIDCANLRRGKPSINHVWGQRKVALSDVAECLGLILMMKGINLQT